MRKTILYLVIFGLLAFAVYYFLFNNNNDMPYSATEAGFTIKDTAAVGKIYIVSSDGESITLDRTDTGWVVNKQYKALRSTLNLLMETLQMQTALYPVTKNAYENVVKALSTDGIKVEVYDRKGLKISVFYVGGTAVNNTGTNMMMANARTPYVVQVQGFNGYLTPRYSTRLRDWRDRTVFNIPPEELKSVSVQYEGKPLKSFVISRDNGKFEVSGDPRITKALDTLNTRKCNLYFKYFTNINCEGYLNGLEDMDKSIKTAPKQSSIDVAGIHGQHQHVDVYWMAINKRSKNRTESNEDVPDDYDADRLYAVTNYKDTILIQQNTFRKIFRQAADFFQKDDMTAVEPGVHTPGGKPVPNLP